MALVPKLGTSVAMLAPRVITWISIGERTANRLEIGIMSPGSSYRSEEFEYDDDGNTSYRRESSERPPHAAPRPDNMPARSNTQKAKRKRQRKAKKKPGAALTGIQRRRDKRWNW